MNFLLQRVVRVLVAVVAPAVSEAGGDHARMLAGAVVVQHARALIAVPELVAGVLVEGRVDTADQPVWVYSGVIVDLAHGLDVNGFPRVRGHRYRQVTRAQSVAFQHGHERQRLERLGAGTQVA